MPTGIHCTRRVEGDAHFRVKKDGNFSLSFLIFCIATQDGIWYNIHAEETEGRFFGCVFLPFFFFRAHSSVSSSLKTEVFMPNTKKRRRFALFFLITILSASLLSLPTSAQSVLRTPLSVTSIAESRYAQIPIRKGNGERLSVEGRLINSTTYLPLRSFFEAYAPGAKLTYYASIRTAELKGRGLTVSARDGSHILYANGRCLYSDTPIKILSDGVMYVPVRMLAKVLSLDVHWNASTRSVTLTGTPVPLEDGATFYGEEDLYWLSRIISAEARGEPFIGQVAVGNIVLNRRAHADYPDTVKEVVLDRQGGVVQFSPVADGSLYQTPYAASVTAAKVCLEGYTVSERILFFYAPSMIKHTWIERNRPYAFTIAGHKFFY